jgi:hypothetical protein
LNVRTLLKCSIVELPTHNLHRKERAVNHHTLYLHLAQQLRSLLHPATNTQVNNLALLTLGLAISPNCHLATIATVLPIEGQRENLIQHLRRVLKDADLLRRRAYGGVIRHLLAHWTAQEIALVMDRTDLADRLSILMLAMAYGKRALPLAWHVLDFGGTRAELQMELLNQAAPWMPEGPRVTLFGDAEFRAVEVQRLCQRRHWHWQVGLKSDLLFREGESAWQPLKTWTVLPGERQYRQNVYLTAEHDFGPVNLVADWQTDKDAPRYTVMDQPANRQAWRRGRKRQWIENFFRDWKSHGFDLEDTDLDDYHRLDGLLLGMSLADVWLLHLGQWLTDTGQRTLLEAKHKHDYSLFRLGRDYLRRAQVMGWEVPIRFTVTHPRSNPTKHGLQAAR